MGDLIKTIFFRPAWYAIFVNPYFIARRGLYNSVLAFARGHLDANAKILDVGCGGKPYRELFRCGQYIGIDVAGGGHSDSAKRADMSFDGAHIPFADNFFDAVICTQVLEHAVDHVALANEIGRVLKPGGEALITVPFVWAEHEQPFDFYRFTRYALRRLFEKKDLQVEKIVATTGVFGTAGQIISAFIFEKFGRWPMVFRLLAAVIICFPIQVLFLFLDVIFLRRGATLDYVVIIKKYGL